MHNGVYDQEPHCLLTESSIKIWKKYKIPPKTPKIGNGLLQLIVVGNFIWLKWVNGNHMSGIFFDHFQAVCCSDHEHCCPEGTTCDVSQGKCNKGDKITNWLMKTQAVALSNPVRCSDTHECPTGNTCCKLKSGEWGCCPKPNVSL